MAKLCLPGLRAASRVIAVSMSSKQMTELLPFRVQVTGIVGIGIHANRDLFHDFQPVAFKADYFFGIVREQANRLETKIREDLGTQAVFAQIHSKPKFLVRLD